MGGSLAGAIASLIGGRLFLWSLNSIFWACTASAVILTCCLVFSDKIYLDNLAAVGVDKTSSQLNMKQLGSIFKLKNFWYLSLFYIGTSAIYDVFDQQFIIFLRASSTRLLKVRWHTAIWPVRRRHLNFCWWSQCLTSSIRLVLKMVWLSMAWF